MSGDEESVLRRWSRRKRTVRTHTVAEEQPQSVAGETDTPRTPENRDGAARESDPTPPSGRRGNLTSDPASDRASDLPDPASLTRESDFRPFLRAGVPDAVQRAALRVLWRSDPIFTTSDGLTDYGEDMRAIGIVPQIVKTAYRVGMGYAATAPETDQAAGAATRKSAADLPETVVPAEGDGVDKSDGVDGVDGTSSDQPSDGALPAGQNTLPETGRD